MLTCATRNVFIAKPSVSLARFDEVGASALQINGNISLSTSRGIPGATYM